ncbi:hypothetical protein SDC9_141366 [bioreactor metagenome]|uniref:Uncharacterized protein n=1 Tax=bioreactor metagenome TaxID=1076179 RepID=A0A645DY31_9ZZZZ
MIDLMVKEDVSARIAVLFARQYACEAAGKGRFPGAARAEHKYFFSFVDGDIQFFQRRFLLI